MKTCRVDRLENSLGSLAVIGQKRLSEGHKRLSTIIDVDAQGNPLYVNWECRLPSGDGQDREHRLLKIPWESFYPNDPLSVAEISVQFDCTVKKKSSADSIEHYLLKPKNPRAGKKDGGKSKKGDHTCKITLNRENDFIAETFLDDQRLEDFLEQKIQEEEERKGPQGFWGKIVGSIHSFLKRCIFWS